MGRWFTNIANNSIGRITTAGVVTSYGGDGIEEPGSITTGPSDAVWFTNFGSTIGRVTTGRWVTDFTGPGFGQPHAITIGSDGAMWFANFDTTIGRITTG
jgi:virginiamycin B lyase